MYMNVTVRRVYRLSFFVLLLSSYTFHIHASPTKDEEYEYTDIGVRLSGDHRDQLIADLIAEERDIRNTGHIAGVDLYHFQVRHKRNRRSKRTLNDLIEDLKRDERIEYVAVGEQLERQKRDFLSDDKLVDLYKKYQQRYVKPSKSYDFDLAYASKFTISFDDTLYQKQWYLENEGQFHSPAAHDINIASSWLAGYSGKGVLICIVDDGIDHPHPELVDHYQAQFSYDLNDLDDPDHDPLPGTYDGQNSHGTQCAGAAAAKANNEVCGVGSAFNANIAGIRILDGPITTLLEARALSMFDEEIDIKSASWGPTDDGTTMEGPGELANGALHYGVTKGRSGKGTLFVWASGNGGVADDDCGADGYVSHHNVISIGSINHVGKTVYFGENCPSTLAVVYTGGMHSRNGHEMRFPVGVVAPDVSGKCTTSFAGTSSAAPIAAGAFALLLEANPDLTYRDVMHIVTETARIPTLSETDDWIINGAGYHVSDKFGFGVLDVGQMVAAAQKWTNVPPRYECSHEYTGGVLKLNIGGKVEVPLQVKECGKITRVEHVIANISFGYHRRGDVKITIISPSGTPSELLSYRKNDASSHGINNFPFMSTHSWGERAAGEWMLRIEGRQPQTSESRKSAEEYGDLGQLGRFALRIYGSQSRTTEEGDPVDKRYEKAAFVPTAQEIEFIYKRELAARNSPNIMQKRDHEQLLERKRMEKRDSNAALPAADGSSSAQSGFKKVIGYIRAGVEYLRKALPFIHTAIAALVGFFKSKKTD